jgi:NADH-quinone oxidoreductase subunit M
MILVFLLAWPFAAGLVAWLAGRRRPQAARWISAVALGIGLVVTIVLWIAKASDVSVTGRGPFIESVHVTWVPQLGISFFLAADGLSLLLVVLCYVLGLLSVVASWRDITRRVGFFHFMLLWSIAALVGVFTALDLFLFYFLFEMMLVPMYFLIALWGHERRVYAAIKFFLFTQIGGLFMLVAILALYIIHHEQTGVYTFDYFRLLGTHLSTATATWLMLGFFAAFAVKLPAVPLHTWLPDAHTQAPTAGSLVLAGLLIKIGAYGMIRFMVPLFPHAAFRAAPVFMGLAVLGILYGAVLAFAQRDLKRLVAYTSVSHMGFVLLGIFAWNTLALQGVVLEIVCHAFSTGALFALVGLMQERVHTRDMEKMGGLWAAAPTMGAAALLFALASLGLPTLGNFVAEFLILVGAWRVSEPATVLAAVGLVAATVYSLWLVQRVFQGRETPAMDLPDLSLREGVMLAAMFAPLLWLGVYPQPVISTARPALAALQLRAPRTTAPAALAPAAAGQSMPLPAATAPPTPIPAVAPQSGAESPSSGVSQ